MELPLVAFVQFHPHYIYMHIILFVIGSLGTTGSENGILGSIK